LITFVLGGSGVIYAAAGAALFGTVFAAVYHAEMVAHRVGEPFGTLILALAVTVIETALIVSVMIAAPAEKAGLARDTVFAAVMIVCNGIVGACLLTGGVRHREQGFQAQGASAALAVLVALTSLTMVLPNLAAPAIKAAQSDRLQTSLNLALGSALATIGLTIPAVATVSIALGYRLELGLEGKEQGLLALTLLLSVITLGTGRTTVLQGIVHLVIFAAFLFFAVVP